MIVALVFGAVVGTMLGLFGGGGSTLAIPLLAYGIGLPPREAIATSLVAVGLSALAGAARHWRRGTLALRVAILFGVVGAGGSAVGAQLARALPAPVQMIVFASIMILAAALMMRRHDQRRAEAGRASTPMVALAALGPGLLTGVAGVGAGFAVVPALVGVTGMPIHRAIGTSLLVIAFNAAGGIASYASYVELDPRILVPFAAAAVVAVVFMTAVGSRIQERNLRVAFAAMLIVIGAVTITWEVIDLATK